MSTAVRHVTRFGVISTAVRYVTWFGVISTAARHVTWFRGDSIAVATMEVPPGVRYMAVT